MLKSRNCFPIRLPFTFICSGCQTLHACLCHIIFCSQMVNFYLRNTPPPHTHTHTHTHTFKCDTFPGCYKLPTAIISLAHNWMLTSSMCKLIFLQVIKFVIHYLLKLTTFYFARCLFVATILLIVTFTNIKSSPVIYLLEYKLTKKLFEQIYSGFYSRFI